jgi:hypothetical protein
MGVLLRDAAIDRSRICKVITESLTERNDDFVHALFLMYSLSLSLSLSSFGNQSIGGSDKWIAVWGGQVYLAIAFFFLLYSLAKYRCLSFSVCASVSFIPPFILFLNLFLPLSLCVFIALTLAYIFETPSLVFASLNYSFFESF